MHTQVNGALDSPQHRPLCWLRSRLLAREEVSDLDVVVADLNSMRVTEVNKLWIRSRRVIVHCQLKVFVCVLWSPVCTPLAPRASTVYFDAGPLWDST